MSYMYTAFECTYRIKGELGLARHVIVTSMDSTRCIKAIAASHCITDTSKIDLIGCVRIKTESVYSIK